MIEEYDPIASAKDLARIGCIRAGLGGDPEGAWQRASPVQQALLVVHVYESLEADRQIGSSAWVATAEAEYWRILGKAN